MSNEQNTAQDNLNVILANLDTILVGVGIPFAVQILSTNAETHTILIGVGYFLTLLNFFHAKFNLNLVEEFTAFTNSSAAWVNFINITLRIVLIGSFIFTAFSIATPVSFIISNLVVRFCDLGMVLILLSTIDNLNMTLPLRNNLKHLNYSWLTGTIVFMTFYFSSLYLLHIKIMDELLFGTIFMTLAFIDVFTDYYVNRRFYFGIPMYVIHKLVNVNSKEYRGATLLLKGLHHETKTDIHNLLYDTVKSTMAPHNPYQAWCIVEKGAVVGLMVTQILPGSRVLFLRYLIVSDFSKWIVVFPQMVVAALSEQIGGQMSYMAFAYHPIGMVIHLDVMKPHTFPVVQQNVTSLLRQIGFKTFSENEHYWFITRPDHEFTKDMLEQSILESMLPPANELHTG